MMTEPHQAEMCEYGDSCIPCLRAEVARLRAENEALRAMLDARGVTPQPSLASSRPRRPMPERQTEPHQAVTEIEAVIVREFGATVVGSFHRQGTRAVAEALAPEVARLRAEGVVYCPHAEVCKTCPCADEDDACFPGERLRAEVARLCAERDSLKDRIDQAERPRVSDITPAWMNYADRLEAEVARLRAERDADRERLVAHYASAMGSLRQRAEAAEARGAELEAEREIARRATDDLLVTVMETEEHERSRIDRAVTERTAEMLMWLRREDPSALKGYWPALHALETEFSAAAEDRIDRAVMERTAALEAALREAISWSYGEDVTPERRDEIERKFLAPTRTQEAGVERSHRDGDGDRRGVSSPPPPACEQRDSDGCAERGPTNPGGQ